MEIRISATSMGTKYYIVIGRKQRTIFGNKIRILFKTWMKFSRPKPFALKSTRKRSRSPTRSWTACSPASSSHRSIRSKQRLAGLKLLGSIRRTYVQEKPSCRRGASRARKRHAILPWLSALSLTAYQRSRSPAVPSTCKCVRSRSIL